MERIRISVERVAKCNKCVGGELQCIHKDPATHGFLHVCDLCKNAKILKRRFPTVTIDELCPSPVEVDFSEN